MKKSVKVVCMECGKKFFTAKLCPECPKCGGGDIDVDWGKVSTAVPLAFRVCTKPVAP